MDKVSQWLQMIDAWVWGPWLLVFLTGTGVYLTVVLKGVQFKYLRYAFRLAFGRSQEKAAGDISHFQSLMTSLAGTIGIGNIAGIATAVAIGGVGSLFWMWVTGLLGMATKYAEALLAVKYRVTDRNGKMCGGPMYYLELGMGSKKWAMLFAFFGAAAALGTGNMVQSHSVAHAIHTLAPVNPWVVGGILAACTGALLVGGIRVIGRACSFLVPVMAVFYLLAALIVIALSIEHLPGAILLIFKSAFTGQAAFGGFAGASFLLAVQMGMARGVFSNEAGLGTSSIAAAVAKTDEPGRQALVSMTGTFITTMVVCTITGLVLATTQVQGLVDGSGQLFNGIALTMRAFDSMLPLGGWIVTFSAVMFAFSTIIGWAYYGEKCAEYLWKERSILPYRLLYTLCVLLGAVMSLEVVWSIGDICNGLMAVPNLVGLLALSRVVKRDHELFEGVIRNERFLA